MEGRGLDDLPRPVVTFFQPRTNVEPVLFSLFVASDSVVKKFLPKSHVSNVIIRDNTSVQRMQEVKLRHLDNSQRKTCSYLDHMKKAFVHKQQKKMNRWKDQYSYYQRMLDLIDQRAMQKATRSAMRLNSMTSSSQLQRKYSTTPHPPKST